MEFFVLGSVEVTSEGRPVALSGQRQHALLAYLLLHANDVVSSERLVDELWFEPPQGGIAALQTQVSRLRKVIGERLSSTGRGYSVRVEPDELDLHRLRALLARAGDASGPAERSRLLQEAELLWRGEPLSGIDAPFAAAEASALDELRYGALEERLDADLERGLAAELLPQLSLLVARRPLREGLRRQQMLALYRAGRQAEALEAYQAARRALDDELGLEPTAALRELERAILRQDPALELPLERRSDIATEPPRRTRRLLLAGAVLGLAGTGGAVAAIVLTHDPVGKQVSPPVEPTAKAPAKQAERTKVATRPHGAATPRRAKPTVHQVVHRPATQTRTVVVRAAPKPAPRQTTAPPTKTATSPGTTTAPARRRPATITDDFAGTQIDSTIWYQIATGTGWTLAQRDGYVEYAFGAGAAPGGQYNQMGGHLGSQCKFPGDFDAHVDFSLPTWPSRNGVFVNLWAFFNNVGYAAWRQSSPQWGELIGSYTGPGDSSGVQLDDLSGSLRLERHDGVMTAYFMHKGSWDPVTSSPSSGPATIAIGANAGSDFAGQPVTVDFRNFSVTADDPVCPPGSSPRSP